MLIKTYKNLKLMTPEQLAAHKQSQKQMYVQRARIKRQKIREGVYFKTRVTNDLAKQIRKKVSNSFRKNVVSNNHQFRIAPWENYSATKNSLDVWCIADTIYALKQTYPDCGYRAIQSHISTINSVTKLSERSLQNLLLAFKNGWKPCSDPTWKIFQKQYVKNREGYYNSLRQQLDCTAQHNRGEQEKYDSVQKRLRKNKPVHNRTHANSMQTLAQSVDFD